MAASGGTSFASTSQSLAGSGSPSIAYGGEARPVHTIARIRPLLKDEAKKIPEYHPIPRPALITLSNSVDPEDEDRKKAMAGTSLAGEASAHTVATNCGVGEDVVLVMDPEKHFARKKGGAFAFRRVLTATDLNGYEQPPVRSLPTAVMGDVYREVRGMVELICNRVNGVVIVCGGPRSGKMTTMFGDIGAVDPEARGILPRYALDVFRAMQLIKPPNSEYKFEVEFVEVMGENTINDLLLPSSQRGNTYPIKIGGETGGSLVTLGGCTSVAVNDGPGMLAQIKAGLRNATRTKASVAGGAAAYSHLIFNLRVTEKSDFQHPEDSTQRVTKVSKYWAQFALISSVPTAFTRCIDIAAQKSTSADKATQQLKVPVRDSTVTRITSEAFCGNCETFCIVCASPFYGHVKDSFNSLEAVAKFGRSKTRPLVSIDAQTSTFRRLHDEMSGITDQISDTNMAHNMVQEELDERQRKLEAAAAAVEAQRTMQDQAEKRYGANEIVKIVKALRLLRLRRAGDTERKALEAELAKADDELKLSLSNVVEISGVNEELAERIDELRNKHIELERNQSEAEVRLSELKTTGDPALRLKELIALKEKEKAAAKQAEEQLVSTKKELDTVQKEIADLDAPKKRRAAAEQKKAEQDQKKTQLDTDVALLEAQVAAADAALKKPTGCSCVVQ